MLLESLVEDGHRATYFVRTVVSASTISPVADHILILLSTSHVASLPIGRHHESLNNLFLLGS